MIKTYKDLKKMKYQYKRAGNYSLQTSDNVTKIIFSGNGSNNLGEMVRSLDNVGSQISCFGDYSFANMKNLQNADLENKKCSQLGGYAFKDCESVQYVNLPHNLEQLNDNTFENCKNMSLLTFTFYESDEYTK